MIGSAEAPRRRRAAPAAPSRSPWRFLGLTYVLAIPFWLLGGAGDAADVVPFGLPTSALMVVCPGTAALLLVHRRQGSGAARPLLRRVVDHRALGVRWYAVTLLTMPVVFLLAQVTMRLLGRSLPDAGRGLVIVPLLLALFFVTAAAEELGWSAYALDPLEARWGPTTAGLALGVAWAAWHVVPYVEGGHSAGWIAWQCLFTVAARVIMVWLYDGAGRSVFAATAFHATINACVFAFGDDGSSYDPGVVGPITAALAVVVVRRPRRAGPVPDLREPPVRGRPA